MSGAVNTKTERVWDRFLTEEDHEVFAASGWGSFLGIGERPALLVVDVTYAFTGDRDEPLMESIARWRNSCGPNAWAAIPHIARLLEAFRERGLPVLYSKGRAPRADGIGKVPWRSARGAEVPDRGPGAPSEFDIVAEIAPRPSEIVIVKEAPSVFFDTRLATYLQMMDADTLVLCGTTTSGCVRATAIDAFSRGLRVAVAEEATFDRGEASHAMSLFDLDAKYADVMATSSIVEAVGQLGGRRGTGTARVSR